jgi:2-polyprenyl-3-methyl-5-hydroxy-6-metoxy-1,4-benzoquinol methylase
VTSDPVEKFYDHLAADYHLIFADWAASIRRHAESLDRLIQDAGLGTSRGAISVLDCTCGIGTQAIGLAERGYRVHATDLSIEAVRRAEAEARRFGVSVTFGVADVRKLRDHVAETFDVVLSCDNALPHLPADADLQLAAEQIFAAVRPGGLFIATIRDYDRILMEKPHSELPRVIDGPDGRRIVFQVWDWQDDGRTYVTNLFIVCQAGNEWQTSHFATTYRAIRRDELSAVLQQAGFSDVRWRMPEESGFFQPVVTARRERGRT